MNEIKHILEHERNKTYFKTRTKNTYFRTRTKPNILQDKN